jgi:hypothetical protein
MVCPDCRGEIPEKSQHCCWCGRRFEIEEEREGDFSQRIPCIDGNCIGTINEEGICNICKKSYTPAEEGA